MTLVILLPTHLLFNNKRKVFFYICQSLLLLRTMNADFFRGKDRIFVLLALNIDLFSACVSYLTFTAASTEFICP